MFRKGFVVFCVFLCACGSSSNKKKSNGNENTFSFQDFSTLFHEVSLPYVLADSSLINHNDTIAIRYSDFPAFIPDSIKTKTFGNGRVRYYALGKAASKGQETLFIVKGVSGSKKAALLLCFDKNHGISSVFPFLVPDDNSATYQTSSIDKSLTVSRNITKIKAGEAPAEGKDVYVYDQGSKKFMLIMRDMLDDQKQDIINPIDSMAATQKYTGDYTKGKRNLVSIRNGRTSRQLMAFVHIESENGNCTGELKGELLFTSPTTATYRQAGDPCVMEFKFASGSVTIKEDEGCGSHRGLDCSFAGTYSKKKQQKAKHTAKVSSKK